MMLFIGADHRGYKTKLKVLKENDELIDVGAFKYDPNDDYPDFAAKLAQKVVDNPGSFGVLICGSGIGMSIAANKIKGIRAALCLNEKQAKTAREHNNANVLCLPADFLKQDQAVKLIKLFLKTKFSQEKKHQRRIEKIKFIERRKQ